MIRRHRGACFLLAMTAMACWGIGACSSNGEYEEEPFDEEDGGDQDTGVQGVDAGRDVRRDRTIIDTGSDVLDAGSDSKDSGGDGGASDAKPDAVDASFPETGTPCSPVGATQSKKCGYCGTSTRVCRDPNDSGTPVWQEWGYCGNQVDGGCEPGTIQDFPCAKCGVMSKKCGNDCRWPAGGSCKDSGPCYPGEIEFVDWLSCDQADQGRIHECGLDCQWSDYSECTTEPRGLTIPSEAGVRKALRVTLGWPENIGGYINGTTSLTPTTCTFYTSTSKYPYAVVELNNPSSTDALISVWTYPATGPSALSSPYDIAIRVLSEDPAIPEGGIDAGWSPSVALQKCAPNKSTYCCGDKTTDPSACPSYTSGTYCSVSPYWGGLMNAEGNGVVVPANTSYYLFVQNLYSTDAPGDIMVGIMTH